MPSCCAVEATTSSASRIMQPQILCGIAHVQHSWAGLKIVSMDLYRRCRAADAHCHVCRCGEWVNAFLLCCRTAGLEVRHVSDCADHVWPEFFWQAQQRWTHMDPCEASFDQPLLYEVSPLP